MIPLKEDQYTEFKTSFSDEVIVSLAAFANAKGGKVYVGVRDDGVPAGVALGAESTAKWINEIKQKTEPSIIPDVEIMEELGKQVVVLSVQEYPVKPVAMKGRYYRRQQNSNHVLSANEIADLILQSRNTSWDAYPHAGASFKSLSEEKMRAFIGRVNQAGRFRLPSNTREALEKLGFLQEGIPTNAAWLLFAKDDTHYNVHIGRFKTPTLIIADKMISGTLFEVAEEAMQTIVGHMKFAFDINIVGADTRRTEISEYPLDAVRELLLNALVHRDYQIPTDVQIKIFDRSISFFNPSGLYGSITEEELNTDSYRASTRNKQIAEAFYLTHDIEKYGSGFLRVRKAIEDYPTMEFKFRNADYGFFSELTYTEQRTANKEAGTKKKSTEKSTEKGTEKSTEKIMSLMRETPTITIAELCRLTGLSDKGVRKNIEKLKHSGTVTRIGPAKGGHWEVNGETNQKKRK